MKALPRVATQEEWQKERDELLLAEKEATRMLDAIAARRRRLPMVRFDSSPYSFETSEGPRTLLDFFGDNDQLVVYQFMDVGPDAFCPGCTHFTGSVTLLSAIAGGGASWCTISNMPLAQMEGYWAQKGWTVPFASSHGTTFSTDCGTTGGFMLTVFLRDGDEIYRTYSTTARGVDRVLFANNILDLVPYGRQEEWEDSPPGWPQFPTYG